MLLDRALLFWVRRSSTGRFGHGPAARRPFPALTNSNSSSKLLVEARRIAFEERAPCWCPFICNSYPSSRWEPLGSLHRPAGLPLALNRLIQWLACVHAIERSSQTRTARGHACAATLSQPKITGTLLTWHSLIGSSEFRANGNAMIAQSHTIQLTLIICGERKLAAEVRTSSAQYIEPHYRICAK